MNGRTVLAAAALLAAGWTAAGVPVSRDSFTGHMTLHLLIVAAASPLLALAVLRQRGPASRALRLVTPLPASLVELVVVWLWHVPPLHHAARTSVAAFLVEQAMFLAAGLLFWLSIVGAAVRVRGRAAGAALVALALTLAHMTLLGALLALAPRVLYPHGPPLEALADQQRGGAVMLVVSAIVYTAAGVVVAHRLLRPGLPLSLERS